MEDTNTIIQDAFNALHPVVQKVLTGADLGEKLQALSKKHALHLDKWTLLENEITMTLLGITDPDSLVDNIVAHVGVDEATARAIAGDAATEIFNPIREELETSLRAEKGTGVTIPQEQKMALSAAEIDIPKSVTEAAPKTVASIVAARIQNSQNAKDDAATPAQDTLPQNPVADSSHMRRAIANDPYREQV